MINKYTVEKFSSFPQFMKYDSIHSFCSDLEKMCQLERAYINKNNIKPLSDGKYLKLHENRYTQQIDGFYNYLVKETDIQNRKSDVSYMFRYVPRSKTSLLREIISYYDDKTEGSDK